MANNDGLRGAGRGGRWLLDVVETKRLFHIATGRSLLHASHLRRYGLLDSSGRRPNPVPGSVVDVPVLGLGLEPAGDVLRLGAAQASPPGAGGTLRLAGARRRGLVVVRIPLGARACLVALVVGASVRVRVTIPDTKLQWFYPQGRIKTKLGLLLQQRRPVD